jgi:hypothetical protein
MGGVADQDGVMVADARKGREGTSPTSTHLFTPLMIQRLERFFSIYSSLLLLCGEG